MIRKIKLLCMMLAGSLILTILLPAGQVEASSGVNSGDAFENLPGDAKYLGSEYRDNYTFDIEETGILEKHLETVNGLANALFAAIRTVAYATVTLFYRALQFDMGELFGEQLHGIQEGLKDSIFEPLLILGFAVCLLSVLVRFLKRDIVGSIAEFGKVVLVIVLAMFVVLRSDVVLSGATKITKGISVDALSNINDNMGISGGTDKIEEFSKKAAGVLWVDLVHEPWKTVEFMHCDIPDSGTIDRFLSADDADERAELVKGFGEAKCFNMLIGYERVGFLLIYLIPCLAKCFIYMMIAGGLIVYQVLAVFYLMLAPVILILFLVIGYESILTVWIKKLFETQVMILVITLMLAFLIRVGVLLFGKADEWGWLIVLIVQIIAGVGLYQNRDKIFRLLEPVQRGREKITNTVEKMHIPEKMAAIRSGATAAKNYIGQRFPMGKQDGAGGIQKAAGGTAPGMGQTGEKSDTRPAYVPVGQAAQTGSNPQSAGQKQPAVAGAAPAAAGQPASGRKERNVRVNMQDRKPLGEPGAAGSVQDVPANANDTLRVSVKEKHRKPLKFCYEKEEKTKIPNVGVQKAGAAGNNGKDREMPQPGNGRKYYKKEEQGKGHSEGMYQEIPSDRRREAGKAVGRKRGSGGRGHKQYLVKGS